MKFTRQIPAIACLGAAALATAPVAAQTTTGVSLYGVIDTCIGLLDLGQVSRTYVGGGCLSGSRWGLRGTEDLGGNLKAYFTLESGFNADDGSAGQGGRLFGRKSLLGLSGDAGAVEMGRDYAPAYYIILPTDPMGLGIGSATSTIWSGSPSAQLARADNAIAYVSPTFAGFSVRAQLAMGEQAAPASPHGGNAKGLNLIYRSGDTFVGVSHARVANAANSDDDSATTLSARQQFGDFSLAVIVQSGAWKGSRTVAAPSSATALFSRDYRSYLIGGSMRVGTGTVNTSYKWYDDRTTSNFDAGQLSISYVYPMSKRTDLYAGLSRLKNKGQSSYSVADASGAFTGVTPGATTGFVALGIRHTF